MEHEQWSWNEHSTAHQESATTILLYFLKISCCSFWADVHEGVDLAQLHWERQNMQSTATERLKRDRKRNTHTNTHKQREQWVYLAPLFLRESSNRISTSEARTSRMRRGTPATGGRWPRSPSTGSRLHTYTTNVDVGQTVRSRTTRYLGIKSETTQISRYK